MNISVKYFLIISLVLGIGCSAIHLTPIEKDGLWGYEDKKENVVIEPEYLMAMEFNEYGIAAVVDDEGWVYINPQGAKLLRPHVVDNGPDYFSEGLARFVEDGKFGFFDEKGLVIIGSDIDYAKPFSEGLAAVCKDCEEVREGEHTSIVGGKWGYIDTGGDLVIPYLYEKAKSFQDGKGEVFKNGEWIFIDDSGFEVQNMEEEF